MAKCIRWHTTKSSMSKSRWNMKENASQYRKQKYVCVYELQKVIKTAESIVIVMNDTSYRLHSVWVRAIMCHHSSARWVFFFDYVKRHTQDILMALVCLPKMKSLIFAFWLLLISFYRWPKKKKKKKSRFFSFFPPCALIFLSIIIFLSFLCATLLVDNA